MKQSLQDYTLLTGTGIVFAALLKTQSMFLIWGNLLKISPGIPLQNVLRSSSRQAEDINRVTNYFFLAAGGMLLVVAILTALVVYRFRASNPKNTETKTLSNNWEFATIGIPSVLVAIFLYMNISTMNKVLPATDNREPDVVITGHQWWWEAQYPGSHVITANEIHLPAGKKLLLKLLSADVVHDWWVPQFGNKMDLVPSQDNFLWITVKEPGEYYGICSEFCGAQHAHMRIKVVAQTQEEYDKWLQHHRQPATASMSGGAQLFMEKTCGNCHRINGTAANGTAGPDLTHLASRQTLLAGLLENTPQNLEKWIRHPQQVKPGANMPDFLLDDTTAKAITTYLYSLK